MAPPGCNHGTLLAWRRPSGRLYAWCEECHRIWRLEERVAAPSGSADLTTRAVDENVEAR